VAVGRVPEQGEVAVGPVCPSTHTAQCPGGHTLEKWVKHREENCSGLLSAFSLKTWWREKKGSARAVEGAGGGAAGGTIKRRPREDHLSWLGEKMNYSPKRTQLIFISPGLLSGCGKLLRHWALPPTPQPPPWRWDGMASGPAAPGTAPRKMPSFGGTVLSPLSRIKAAGPLPARSAWVWGRTRDRACPPASAAEALGDAGTRAAFARLGPSPPGGKQHLRGARCREQGTAVCVLCFAQGSGHFRVKWSSLWYLAPFFDIMSWEEKKKVK